MRCAPDKRKFPRGPPVHYLYNIKFKKVNWKFYRKPHFFFQPSVRKCRTCARARPDLRIIGIRIRTHAHNSYPARTTSHLYIERGRFGNRKFSAAKTARTRCTPTGTRCRRSFDYAIYYLRPNYKYIIIL